MENEEEAGWGGPPQTSFVQAPPHCREQKGVGKRGEAGLGPGLSTLLGLRQGNAADHGRTDPE